MAADGDADDDTSRTTVTTYVPAYQKTAWADHADRLGMSQSEFVRTMVQAGRRGFDPDPPDDTPEPSSTPDPDSPSLEDRVVSVLSEEEYLDWEALLTAVTDDVESRLESALDELQAANRVQHSGRNGGYTLTEGEE